MKRSSPAKKVIVTVVVILVSYFETVSGSSRYEFLLKSPEGRRKLTILAELEESRSVSADLIEPLLNDPDELIRLRCAELLGRIADSECVQYLERLTNDENPEVVKTAVFSLGLTGCEAALEPIKRCLRNRPNDIKARALEALGKTRKKEVAPLIASFLKTFHSSLRAEAALAIAMLGDSASAGEVINSLHDPNAHVVSCAVYAIGRLGYKEAAGNIIPLLDYDSAEVRLRAAEALGRLKENRAVDPLAARLKDSDRMVVIKSAEALSRIGGKNGAKALEGFLASEDSYIKTVALNGIAAAGYEKSFKAVSPLVEDKSSMVRRAALEAAAATGGEDARELLLRTLHEGSPSEKMTALEQLGVLGSAQDLPLMLETLSSHKEHLLREGAAAGLGKWKNPADLAKVTGIGEGERRPIDVLLEAAGDEDWVVATMAIESLGRVATPEIIRDLIHLYHIHDTRLDSDRRLAIIGAIESLGAKLDPQHDELSMITHFLGEAARNRDPRICERAVRSGDKFGVEMKSQPSGEWKRGTTPWGRPSLPLGERRIVIATGRGDIEVMLYGDDAPGIVRSIIGLAEDGFYEGLTFHRVVPGFVIQGGCPRGDGWGDAGYFLRSQFNLHRYERGTVGMAHAGKDTPGSQIFITHTPQPHLNGRYTVVGRVTKGMDVADRIETGDSFSVIVIE